MKIVHLVTSTTGGAAQAAVRLHESLSENDCDSKIFSIARRASNKVNVPVVEQKVAPILRLGSSALTLIQEKVIQKSVYPVSPVSIDLLDWSNSEIESADLLHLHAFYNLVSVQSFLSRYPHKRKVVTLHDERFFTGGCHYKMECEQINNGCQHCPQVRIPFRPIVAKQRHNVNELIRENLDITFVCPSLWIMKRAMSAFPELSRTHFEQIYNPIPHVASSLIEIPTRANRISFGFIAQDLDNPFKCLNLLLAAFKKVTEKRPDKYTLTLVGNSRSNYSTEHSNITQQAVTSTIELQKVLNTIDVLVIPSAHDNLPNVLGEALMSGAGLIGSNVGGIPEIVDKFSQTLFESGDQAGLVEAMLNYELSDRSVLQEMAKSVFSYQSIAKKMINVYSKTP